MEGTRTMLHLDIDLLRHIMVLLATSAHGYVGIAHITSVCKDLKELSGDKDLLKVVSFDYTCVSHPDASFRKTDGLLAKCARAGNKVACCILLKHVNEQMNSTRIKAAAWDAAIRDCKEKILAVEAVNTRARARAVELAWEDVISKHEEIIKDCHAIDQLTDAIKTGERSA